MDWDAMQNILIWRVEQNNVNVHNIVTDTQMHILYEEHMNKASSVLYRQ